MGFTRRFYGEPVERLIISVPVTQANWIRAVIRERGNPYGRNLSEFIRQAIAEKLNRK